MTRILVIVCLLPLILVSCPDGPETPRVFSDEALIDIAEYIEKNKEKHSRFSQIMIEGDMKNPLSAYNPSGTGYTLFLPTDEAFDRYIQNNDEYSSFEELIADKEFVRILGRYHLVHTQLQTNEFPYGAMPDTTSTGDILTIGFSSSLDSTVYRINNVAPIINPNLEMINGYIHVISEVLKPINFNGFQWLQDHGGYSILSDALSMTGLKDTLGFFRTTESGQVISNKYTILAEHDSIFNRYGISSTEDLVSRFGTPGIPLNNPDNQLYQFAAYHLLEGAYFLVDFEVSRNYNTYANAPVRIVTGLEVRINPGVDTFRLVISDQGDTTYIRHIELFYQESDINSKTGPIHFVNELMEFYTPPNSEQTFQFYEAPEINQLRNTSGTHYLFEDEQDELEVISWTGPDDIIYYKTTAGSEKALNKDYLEIEGNFTISYTMPKILPGKYEMYVRADGYNNNNEHPTILVYLDGKRMGATFNLNSGGTSSNHYNANSGKGYMAGEVEFSLYREHTITIETFIPGRLRWDAVTFTPVK